MTSTQGLLPLNLVQWLLVEHLDVLFVFLITTMAIMFLAVSVLEMMFRGVSEQTHSGTMHFYGGLAAIQSVCCGLLLTWVYCWLTL